MSNKPVRTRFAPSPTGSLHIGGLRTALYSWMIARQHDGQFVLRLEDTDRKRLEEDAIGGLYEALRWAGLDWDEGPDVGGPHGPYVQSERLDTYQKWADWLIENDHAYYCYCSSERLQKVNEDRQKRKLPPGYDRRCRTLTPEKRDELAAEAAAEGRNPIIRFKFPLEGETAFPDLIRGETTFENKQQQDAVLLKGDGFPTYHLAVVIDDHDMEISHVMRGIEWLPSAPLHYQLWKAFGWEMPLYAHLPLILNPNGKGKLSKRKPPTDKYGNVLPIMVHDYMDGGYVRDALINFVLNVGWSFGDDQEVFTLEEAMTRFKLEDLNPANSAFPIDKLEWINGIYIREKMDDDQLADALRKPLEDAGLTIDDDLLMQIVPIVRTRIKTFNDVVDLAGFFFHEEFTPPEADNLIQKKQEAADTLEMMQKSVDALKGMDDWGNEATYEAMKAFAKEHGYKNGQVFGALRVAATGQRISPPTFETMEILGKEESLRRFAIALEILQKAS